MIPVLSPIFSAARSDLDALRLQLLLKGLRVVAIDEGAVVVDARGRFGCLLIPSAVCPIPIDTFNGSLFSLCSSGLKIAP